MKKRLFFNFRGTRFFCNLTFFSTMSAKVRRSLLLFCILIITFTFYSYIAFNPIHRKAEKLENKIANLNADIKDRDQQIKSFRLKIDSLRLKLTHLNQLANNIKMAIGIDPKESSSDHLGVGGSFAKNIDLSLIEPAAYDQWVKNLNEEVNRLDFETVNQFDEYQVLLETVKEIKKVQDATPSISPVEGGQISSNFGYRQSPFTGNKEFHSGLDISEP